MGTALHVPWVVLAADSAGGLLAQLPACYTLFAAAVLIVAVAGSNLDSFERYALSAFPLSMAAALLCARPSVERVVLVLLPAALAGVCPAGVPEHLRAAEARASILLTAH